MSSLVYNGFPNTPWVKPRVKDGAQPAVVRGAPGSRGNRFGVKLLLQGDEVGDWDEAVGRMLQLRQGEDTGMWAWALCRAL